MYVWFYLFMHICIIHDKFEYVIICVYIYLYIHNHHPTCAYIYLLHLYICISICMLYVWGCSNQAWGFGSNQASINLSSTENLLSFRSKAWGRARLWAPMAKQMGTLVLSSITMSIYIYTVADQHLEFKKKIKVLEYGFMLIFNILEPGVKSTKNIQIEGVHIEYFCSMLS